MKRLFLSARLLAVTFCAAILALAPAARAADDRVFELRIYTTNEGKLPDLLKRFREHTCALFEKHGIENVGYWVPIEKEDGADNKLYYIIAHKSRDAAKASWAAFQADPDWKAASKASEENGKILAGKPESIFMTATEFSNPIVAAASPTERVFQLRMYTTPEGKLPALHKRFKEQEMALFAKHGMFHIGYWQPMDEGNKLFYMLAHPSKEAGLKSFADFRADPDWVKLKAESEKDGSLTVQPDGVKFIYMKATDFSPIR